MPSAAGIAYGMLLYGLPVWAAIIFLGIVAPIVGLWAMIRDWPVE